MNKYFFLIASIQNCLSLWSYFILNALVVGRTNHLLSCFNFWIMHFLKLLESCKIHSMKQRRWFEMIRDLGLGYVKIDACEENCMLYWKENAKNSECWVCGPLRWKSSEGSVRAKKVPHKILRYFPLTPRLKRLFMSKKTTSYMTWHYDKRIDDGVWQR